MALIRTALLGGLAYLAIAVSYPDWSGRAYHVLALALIAGGAVGVWFIHKILDLGEGAAKIAVEAAFIAGTALLAGYTMPQKSGKPPFQQWSEGVRPTRAAARRGLQRLGMNPDGATASTIVSLFPKR